MSDTECEVCGREFETYMGKQKHKSASHDPNYKDEEWLREQYNERGKSISEISEECGVDYKTVYNYIDKYEIDTRGFGWRVQRATHYIGSNGYEWWGCGVNDEKVRVHRLLAVAEFGFEEVCGMHVHHKNRIPWDNRDENIELMGHSEHSSYHYDDPWKAGEVVDKEVCDEISEKRRRGWTQREVSEALGVSRGAVARHDRGECRH